MKNKRIVLTPMQAKTLPIYAESIGFNRNQEGIVRPKGYPHYHWLQTVSGEGSLLFNGQKYTLNPGNGILLSPRTAHAYKAITEPWKTVYFTFNGEMVADILTYISLRPNEVLEWEFENPISNQINCILQEIESKEDVFGLQSSTAVYNFILMLKNYVRQEKNTAVSENLDQLQPLIQWMKLNISDPNIGLGEFADFLDLSPRHLNGIFRETFAVSPYAYFLDLRIRTAKQLLFESKELTIKQITRKVGFRSPSHFVATFKKIVGMPPDQFRQLH